METAEISAEDAIADNVEEISASDESDDSAEEIHPASLDVIQASDSNIHEVSSEEEEEHVEEQIDEHIELSDLTKSQLLKLLKDKIQHGAVLKLDKLAHEIKAAFDELVSKDKDEALTKFKADGGSEDDFEYRQHEEEREFSKTFNDFRYQLNSQRKDAEKLKEKNLTAKTCLLYTSDAADE